MMRMRMTRWLIGFVVLATVALAAGQTPTAQSSVQTSTAAPAASNTPQTGTSSPPADAQKPAPSTGTQPPADTSAQSDDDTKDVSQPGTFGKLKRHVRKQVDDGCISIFGCWSRPAQYPDEQQPADKPELSDKDRADHNAQQTSELAQRPPQQKTPPENPAPPRSDTQGRVPAPDESSSNETKVPLTPPPGEEGLDLHRGAPPAGSNDVEEVKPWDPHKADKNVEIGDFYLKRRNLAAAISRYREALYWKSDDAVATMRLAQALEQVGQYAEARKNYQQYLKILPHGSYAEEATAALSRLKDKPDEQRAKM